MYRLGALLTIVVAALSLGFSSVSVGASSLQNFTINSFHADYYLSKDQDGRASLRVVETIDVAFPDYNQNKGIYRSIPREYNKHPLSLDIVSLTRNDKTEPIYDKSVEGGFMMVSTGNDDYVTGNQVYQLTYTLRDVAVDFESHQEFYWNINGFDWKQRIDNVSVRVHLDDSIRTSFTEETACYFGERGSSIACGLTRADSGQVEFSSEGSAPSGHNLTIVMGFEADTFKPYEPSLLTKMVPFVTVGIIVTGLAIVLFDWITVTRRNRNAKGRGIVVPQYLPPDDTLEVSANLTGHTMRFMAAQIVDMAVKRFVRIIETQNSSRFFGSKSKIFSVELVSVDGIEQDKLDLVNILFGGKNIGARYEFTNKYNSQSVNLGRYARRPSKSIVHTGYRRKADTKRSWFGKLLVAIWVLSVIAFTVLLAIDTNATHLIAMVTAPGFMLMMMMFVFSPRAIFANDPLTDEGANARDYLNGLSEYIRLAEVDRFRVLHSVTGAERQPIDTSDKEQMIKMYERLLPYAVLFGAEKSWARALEIYYADTHTTPDWSSGMSAGIGFDIAALALSINSVSVSAGSPGGGFSSSSSGLGGGGFSGGGGGGGGGGGR